MNSQSAWNKKVDLDSLPYQFHFNTFKLNDYLENICVSRDIKIIKDEIIDVNLNNDNISSIQGTNQQYNFDFYIDCTGFKRLLIKKLGAKWQSYSKYLKMNSAIAFQTEDTEEYNPYTLAVAMDYGWMWRIPVWGRWGNGYVFCDEYIDENQAKKEVEKYLGHEIEVRKSVKFDPGCLDKTWIGNCVAIGLSSNFVEPLEATSIGSTINQVFLLMHYLQNYSQQSIAVYNKKTNDILENIRDFIVLHYMVSKQNSKFWKDIRSIEVPPHLKSNLVRWSNNLPIKEDIGTTEYVLFFEQNWTNILYGLDLFNTESIGLEYNQISQVHKTMVDQALDFPQNSHIGHKEYISNIRKSKS